MKKKKLKSTTPGPTKTHHTKRFINSEHTCFLEGQRYSVPKKVFLKLKKELQPFSSEDLNAISYNDFFKNESSNLPEWAMLLIGLRHRENLTQNQFAKLLDLSQSNLSAMENGKRPIGKELAKRIATKFKVDYRYFL